MGKYVLFVFICSICFLSACTTVTPAVENANIISTDQPPTFTVTSEPSLTSSPTVADTPTREEIATETPKPSETATQTPTASPTPFLGFEQIKLNNAEHSNGQTLFIFSVPGVSMPYFATDGTHNFACDVDTNYPDVLICVTDHFSVKNGYITVDFFQDETMSDLVFRGEFHTGLTNAAEALPDPFPITWAGPETWCELRGQNVTCETEYRLYHGEPCIASTCYDACGWYYSIDTCPYDDDDFEFIPKPPGW